MAEPTVTELTKQLADIQAQVQSGQTALNITWTLLCGFMVMFMQAGFALVETGLCRAKNAGHRYHHQKTPMSIPFFMLIQEHAGLHLLERRGHSNPRQLCLENLRQKGVFLLQPARGVGDIDRCIAHA